MANEATWDMVQMRVTPGPQNQAQRTQSVSPIGLVVNGLHCAASHTHDFSLTCQLLNHAVLQPESALYLVDQVGLPTRPNPDVPVSDNSPAVGDGNHGATGVRDPHLARASLFGQRSASTCPGFLFSREDLASRAGPSCGWVEYLPFTV